jgi:hypothetical protein
MITRNRHGNDNPRFTIPRRSDDRGHRESAPETGFLNRISDFAASRPAILLAAAATTGILIGILVKRK